MNRRLLLWLMMAPVAAGGARAQGSARPGLLVETAWVAEHGRDTGVRLVDMRDEEAYAAGHIPGAARVQEGALRDPADRATYLPRPEDFAAMMRTAGIGNDTHVVIYDDLGGRSAARLWYVLHAYGHDRASLVNGGWTRWTAEKRPVSRDAPAASPATFTPKHAPALTCPSEEVLKRAKGVVVLDTRSTDEHRGGRIPGAVNVDWEENLTAEKTFKPLPELRRLYESRGIRPDREIITHCASGGRAAHSLFALKLLGYPKVRIYYGSFSDYRARPGAPVER